MIGCLFGLHDWYTYYPMSYEACHHCDAERTLGWFIHGKNDREGSKMTYVHKQTKTMWGKLIKEEEQKITV